MICEAGLNRSATRLPVAFPDHVDEGGADVVLHGKNLRRQRALVDAAHIFVTELCAWVFHPSKRGRSNSPLAGCVLHVVQLCAEEQMLRPDARWIVAAVKHAQVSRDWANELGLGNAMRETRSLSDVDQPVAIFIACTLPLPALAVELPSSLKALFHGLRGTSRHLDRPHTSTAANDRRFGPTCERMVAVSAMQACLRHAEISRHCCQNEG